MNINEVRRKKNEEEKLSFPGKLQEKILFFHEFHKKCNI